MIKKWLLKLLGHENCFNSCTKELKNANKQISYLVKQIENKLKPKVKTAEKKLEELWNTKRPSKNRYAYLARPIINSGGNEMVSPFLFYVHDPFIPTIKKDTNDEIAKEALAFVIRYIQYVQDSKQFKTPEMWLFPFETLLLRKGDCEDGAILLANILITSGVPYWRVRLNAGDVKGGGHCWVTYLKESTNEWVILDWSYWPDEKTKSLNKTYKEAEKYFKIWFSWNTKFIYLDAIYEREVVKNER